MSLSESFSSFRQETMSDFCTKQCQRRKAAQNLRAGTMNCKCPRPGARIRLFCFPWAGGGSNYYHAWSRYISEDVEVYALCLPGREDRIDEPVIKDGKKLVEWIVKTIHDEYFDKPFAFYGHSLGGCLALNASVNLKRRYNREPEYLFVSGCPLLLAQNLFQNLISIWSNTVLNVLPYISKRIFLWYMGPLVGSSSSTIDDPVWMEKEFPVMLADVSLVSHLRLDFTHDQDSPLSCPMDYFEGKQDIYHDIFAWAKMTTGPFKYRSFHGGHFFLKNFTNVKRITHYINQTIGGRKAGAISRPFRESPGQGRD